MYLIYYQELQPLQILGAVINQLRKVLLAKEFVTTAGKRLWQPGMPFARFKNAVLPALMDYEASLAGLLGEWSAALAKPVAGGSGKGKSKAKGQTLTTDLVLAFPTSIAPPLT